VAVAAVTESARYRFFAPLCRRAGPVPAPSDREYRPPKGGATRIFMDFAGRDFDRFEPLFITRDIWVPFVGEQVNYPFPSARPPSDALMIRPPVISARRWWNHLCRLVSVPPTTPGTSPNVELNTQPNSSPGSTSISSWVAKAAAGAAHGYEDTQRSPSSESQGKGRQTVAPAAPAAIAAAPHRHAFTAGARRSIGIPPPFLSTIY
jgi:hypothetical protein